MRERVGERQGQNADADAESTPPYGDRLEAANCNQVANPQLSSKDKPPSGPAGGLAPTPGLAPLSLCRQQHRTPHTLSRPDALRISRINRRQRSNSRQGGVLSPLPRRFIPLLPKVIRTQKNPHRETGGGGWRSYPLVMPGGSGRRYP